MSDPTALEELKNLGYMTVPVIQINGQVIVGLTKRGSTPT
jgi:glutaredoxin